MHHTWRIDRSIESKLTRQNSRRRDLPVELESQDVASLEGLHDGHRSAVAKVLKTRQREAPWKCTFSKKIRERQGAKIGKDHHFQAATAIVTF